MSTTTTASGFGSTATDKNTPQSFVSSTTTQPLILVCLAIGLFSAVSIAILGWRRANNLRVERVREEERRRRRRYTGVDGGQFGIGGITTEEATSMGLCNGETPPRLWDLRTSVDVDLNGVVHDEDWAGRKRERAVAVKDVSEVLRFTWEGIMVQQQISGGLSPPQEHEENTMLMMTLARNYTDGMEEVRTFQKKNHLEDHVKHGRKTHAFQIAVAIALPRRHVANGGPRRYGYEPDVPGKYRLPKFLEFPSYSAGTSTTYLKLPGRHGY
ncbi:hypothetical protein F5051DRAFT_430454 [Lentinula edodes]|nr:hypothetical protein F5051DRAFT_430454 [Lentinula edodes]